MLSLLSGGLFVVIKSCLITHLIFKIESFNSASICIITLNKNIKFNNCYCIRIRMAVI